MKYLFEAIFDIDDDIENISSNDSIIDINNLDFEDFLDDLLVTMDNDSKIANRMFRRLRILPECVFGPENNDSNGILTKSDIVYNPLKEYIQYNNFSVTVDGAGLYQYVNVCSFYTINYLYKELFKKYGSRVKVKSVSNSNWQVLDLNKIDRAAQEKSIFNCMLNTDEKQFLLFSNYATHTWDSGAEAINYDDMASLIRELNLHMDKKINGINFDNEFFKIYANNVFDIINEFPEIKYICYRNTNPYSSSIINAYKFFKNPDQKDLYFKIISHISFYKDIWKKCFATFNRVDLNNNVKPNPFIILQYFTGICGDSFGLNYRKNTKMQLVDIVPNSFLHFDISSVDKILYDDIYIFVNNISEDEEKQNNMMYKNFVFVFKNKEHKLVIDCQLKIF